MDPSGVKGNSRIRGVYVFKRKRKLQWSRPFKITMRYSLGTHRGQRKFSRKGVYVSKSKKNLQCSLPLKSPGDILLDPVGVKRNPCVRAVSVFKSPKLTTVEPAFKITRRYSLGSSRGQRNFLRKGGVCI